MKKKIIGILVCMLLVIPVLLVVATEKETTEKSLPVSSNGIYEDQKTYDNCHLDSASPFGVFGDIFYDPNTGRLNLDEAIELGNQITRLILTWWMVEPEEGKFTFDLPDLVIDMHYNARISPVITLLSNSEWATRGIGGPEITGSSPPINMTQYERYVRTVVNRYKDKVEYWQIENEVSDTTIEPSPRFWNGTKEEYLELLQHAYITIKQVDPDAKVVLQGFADGMFILINEGNTTIQEFFEYLMDNGSSYFDVIDFHQYFEPDTVYLEVNMLKETMSKYGYQKELICTEAGDLDLRLFGKHLLNPDEPIPIIEQLLSIDEVALELMEIMRDGVTEQELIDFAVFLKTNSEPRPILEKYQAENLVKRVSLTLSQGVKQIHWVGMIDSEASVAVDWYWAMMPLIDTDGRKKPHFYTYKLLIDELENFTITNEISFNPDEKIIRFNFSDKNNVYVIWGKNSTTVNLSSYVSTDYVHVTHIVTGLDEGNNPIYPQDEIALSEKIPISETPIFVEETSVQINVNIARPKEGHLYVSDQEIMPTIFHSTIIIGEITIKADAYDEDGVDRVEFYIDGVLKSSDTEYPYGWLWDEKTMGRHTIKVVAYDNASNIASDEEKVMIFNI
jgi:hypothetical protein